MSITCRNITNAAIQTAALGIVGFAIGAGMGVVTTTVMTTALATSILFSGTLALWYCIRMIGEGAKIQEWKVALLAGMSLIAPLIAANQLLQGVVAAFMVCTFAPPFVMAAAGVLMVAFACFFGYGFAIANISVIIGLGKRNDSSIMQHALPHKLFSPLTVPWNFSLSTASRV